MKRTNAMYVVLFTIGAAGCGAQPDGSGGPGTPDDIGVETQKVFSRELYRFYNSSVNRHFYTTVFAEGAQVGYPGFEGTAGRCETTPAPNRARLQRLYHGATGGWLYTIDQGEVNVALSIGWDLNHDMVAAPCYVTWQQQAGTCPMYRLYYGRSDDHFYTQSWNEAQSARNSFYQLEGVGFYLGPVGAQCPQ